MSIADIENKTYSELKAERDAVIKQATALEAFVLADRYIKALTDAKHRDEVMGEQGKTITALQGGAEASRQRLEAVGTELAQCQAELQSLQTELADKVASAAGQLNTLKARCANETERASRLKAEASRNFAALSGVAKQANDALSQHAIENADQG